MKQFKNLTKQQQWGIYGLIGILVIWGLVAIITSNNSQQALDNAKSAYSSGNIRVALEQYEEITKGSNKNNPEAWNNLGNVYRDNANPEKALGAYKQAINLKSDYEQAYRNLANLYLDLALDNEDKRDDYLQEGIQILEGGKQSNPDSVVIIEDLIKFYDRIGDSATVNSYLQIREQLLNQ